MFTKSVHRVAALCLIFCGSVYAEDQVALDLEAVNDYIGQVFDVLVKSEVELDVCALDDLDEIRAAANAAATKMKLWERLLGRDVVRTVKYVQEVVCEVIFDFIENKSYEIALEKTNNKAIALKVSSGIRVYAEHRVDATKNLKPGTLEKFIGRPLTEMVEGDCRHFDNVQETVQMKIVKCKFCRKKFVDAEFVVISPCGHSLCRTCAYDFFVKQEYRKCPRCTDLVDITKLLEELSVDITF